MPDEVKMPDQGRTEQEVMMDLLESLPDNLFGDEETPKVAGTEETPAGEEAEGDDFDAEAADALSEDGEEETVDEAEEETTEPEEDSEGDEEAEEEPEVVTEDPMFTVRVDGQDLRVSLAELQAGYSRTASWTRKSQKLAEDRKSFEAEREAIAAERQRYRESLGALEVQLATGMPEKPSSNDPRAWIEYQERLNELKDVQAKRAEVEHKMQLDYQRQMEEHMHHQAARLLEEIPEWEDSDLAKREQDGIVRFATAFGFTEQELENLSDYRVILLFRKAMLAEELEKEKEKLAGKKAKAPTLKPGSSRPRTKAATKTRRAAKASADKVARLKETGHVRDAARVFEDMDF